MRLLGRWAWAGALLAAAALVRADGDAAGRKATGSRAAAASAKVLDVPFITPEGMEIRLAGVLAPGEGGGTLSQSYTARATLAALLGSAPLTLGGDEGARDHRTRSQVMASAPQDRRDSDAGSPEKEGSTLGARPPLAP
jgi:hypothetical protein